VIEEDEFNRSFDEALRELQQTVTAVKHEAKARVNPVYEGLAKSVFKGYETTKVTDAKVVAVINDNEIVLDRTPFYSESGGQVGDQGLLVGPGNTLAVVEDTYSPVQGVIVHKVQMQEGTLRVGDVVSAEVDVEKRDATRRNHTATPDACCVA
jgi:alanyl-tRNA synthetase